jgi:leader peptidase (prepilin peptidase)/N-methyltransferase
VSLVLALVAWCAAAGYAIGLLIQPAVERVVATRSEAAAAPVRSSLLAPLTAAVFAITGWQVGWNWTLPAYLALGGFLVALSIIDLDTKTLPRRIVWTAGAVGVGLLTAVSLAAGEPERLVSAAIGAAIAFVVLLVLHIVARGGFGFGDVRLGAVLGWYLGWQGLSTLVPAMLLSFGLSAVVGLALMVVGRAGRKTEVPFGPFLAAGALIVLLVGYSSGVALPA